MGNVNLRLKLLQELIITEVKFIESDDEYD